MKSTAKGGGSKYLIFYAAAFSDDKMLNVDRESYSSTLPFLRISDLAKSYRSVDTTKTTADTSIPTPPEKVVKFELSEEKQEKDAEVEPQKKDLWSRCQRMML